jgi:hypothetical protein
MTATSNSPASPSRSSRRTSSALESAPPKETDRRRFEGDETYQVEAIDPRELARILTEAITTRLDRPVYDAVLAAELEARQDVISRRDLRPARVRDIMQGAAAVARRCRPLTH